MILILVALAGFVAGFMNVLAGGGSFLTLPVMIAAGLTALGANASSTVALFPGQVVSAFMARQDFKLAALDPQGEAGAINLKLLSVLSLVGGFFGALLLLFTPPDVFIKIVPWLILFATGVFIRGSAVGTEAPRMRLGPKGVYAVQAVVSIYGGYFGGGIGILMLAALTLFGLRDIRVMNAIKMMLAMLMNVAAVLTFVVAGLVQWRPALVLAVAAVVGSLAGIAAAKKVPPAYVRGFVICVGLTLTIGFFLKG